MIGTLVARYQHRGAWLVVLGLMWGVFAAGTLASPAARARSFVLIEYLPTVVQALLWLLTGATAFVVGVLGARRGNDSLGHVALYVMPAVKLLSFIGSGLAYSVTSAVHAYNPDTQVLGWSGAWYAASLWALVSVMLGLTAAWPNPTPPLVEPPASSRGGA